MCIQNVSLTALLEKNINSCSDIKAAAYGLSLYSDPASSR